MGVSSISVPDVHSSAVPAAARTPLYGVPEKAPKQASVAKHVDTTAEQKRVDPVVLSNTTSIRLRVDEATNRIIAQVVDENNEVVRQIPPEDALRIAANTRHLLGLLFDKTV